MNIDKRNNYDGDMVKNGIDTFSGYICTNATEIPKEVSQNIAQFNIKKPNEKIFVKVNANYEYICKIVLKFYEHILVLF